MARAGIGKRNEFLVWAELLKRDLDVYPVLVDNKKIDGIVGFNRKLRPVQIKSGKHWNNPRGISYNLCKEHPDMIVIIYNYHENKFIFLTTKQILNEPEWKQTIKWEFSQLKWNQKLREKYQHQDLDHLAQYMRGRRKL